MGEGEGKKLPWGRGDCWEALQLDLQEILLDVAPVLHVADAVPLAAADAVHQQHQLAACPNVGGGGDARLSLAHGLSAHLPTSRH